MSDAALKTPTSPFPYIPQLVEPRRRKGDVVVLGFRDAVVYPEYFELHDCLFRRVDVEGYRFIILSFKGVVTISETAALVVSLWVDTILRRDGFKLKLACANDGILRRLQPLLDRVRTRYNCELANFIFDGDDAEDEAIDELNRDAGYRIPHKRKPLPVPSLNGKHRVPAHGPVPVAALDAEAEAPSDPAPAPAPQLAAVAST